MRGSHHCRQHRVFAAVYDRVTARLERQGLAELRARLLGPLHGDVVEVGAGTGANLAHYGPLRSLTLLEPDPAMARRLRRRLSEAASIADLRVETLEAARIPSGSVDAVVCTLVLCTVPDPASLLDEVRRILRPGGELVLVEHVRHDGQLSGCLQTLLTPLQRLVAAGCHLNRRTAATVAAAGFDITGLEPTTVFSAVPPLASGVAGVARAPLAGARHT